MVLFLWGAVRSEEAREEEIEPRADRMWEVEDESFDSVEVQI
jgi:hypothetical protein